MRGSVIEATYDLCSPLFLGGGERLPRHPQFEPENEVAAFRMSAAPFIGALRFWWRALSWPRVPGATDAERLANLKTAEEALFGSASRGQGKFLVKRVGFVDVEGKYIATPEPRRGLPNGWDAGPLKYLANQGVTTDANKKVPEQLQTPGAPERYRSEGQECIWEDNLRLKLQILIKPNQEGAVDIFGGNQLAHASLVEALQALGLIGGVGARARRGFGSLALRRLIVRPLAAPNSDASEAPAQPEKSLFAPPASLDDYRQAIEALKESAESSVPPSFPVFSSNMRVQVYSPGQQNTPQAALQAVGGAYQLFRSWGYQNRQEGHNPPHRVGHSLALWLQDSPAKEFYLFKEDHDWFQRARQRQGAAGQRIDRAALGMPLQFRKGGQTITIEPKEGGRLASPLHFHVHKLPAGGAAVAVIYLPTSGMPDLKLVSRRGAVEGPKVQMPDHARINQIYSTFFDYLNHRLGPQP